MTSMQVIGLGGFSIATERTNETSIGGEIRVLMPARVTSILANQGDSVDVDIPLPIIQPMKIQNEVVSPVAGRVKSVRVQEGSRIKKGSVLLEIERT